MAFRSVHVSIGRSESTTSSNDPKTMPSRAHLRPLHVTARPERNFCRWVWSWVDLDGVKVKIYFEFGERRNWCMRATEEEVG